MGETNPAQQPQACGPHYRIGAVVDAPAIQRAIADIDAGRPVDEGRENEGDLIKATPEFLCVHGALHSGLRVRGARRGGRLPAGLAFGSLRCDCDPQLEAVPAEGRGVVPYVRGHEGGTGLPHKP